MCIFQKSKAVRSMLKRCNIRKEQKMLYVIDNSLRTKSQAWYYYASFNIKEGNL